MWPIFVTLLVVATSHSLATEYRTYTGANNNPGNPSLGSANSVKMN